MTDPTDVFQAERERLKGLAYRMLGTVADADDVVQDAWLRWQGVDHTEIVNPAGFLTTVTARLAIDRLTSAQKRRETYVGSWLPEPYAVHPDGDPASSVVVDESIMLGFLAVLERLGAVERAVFVLREVFALPYDEVAEIVDRSPENCRQIARRARDHVRAERPRVPPDAQRDRELLDAFLVAVASGESGRLEQLLHDEVVLVSDGGENVRAARHPIVGPARVSRFLTGIVRNAAHGPVHLEHVLANGQVSLYVDLDGVDRSLFTLERDTTGTRIRRIFVLRNPDKLGGVGLVS